VVSRARHWSLRIQAVGEHRGGSIIRDAQPRQSAVTDGAVWLAARSMQHIPSDDRSRPALASSGVLMCRWQQQLAHASSEASMAAPNGA
jgi:hypothetical protein